jgi:iron complex outermembrane recepter protein
MWPVMGGGELVRATLATAAACLCLVGITCANDVEAAIRRPTNIAPQELAPALQMLAKDRAIQLIYRSDLVKDQRTSGAAGDLTFDEALTQLLSGTGLTFRYLESNAITIVPLQAQEPPGASEKSDDDSPRSDGRAAATPGSNDGRIALEEVIVTAQKREERLQEVPGSVSAIQGKKLSDLGLSQLADYAQYVPGLAVQNGGSPGQASVALRGIAAVGPGSVVGYYIDDTPLGSSTNYALATLFALDLMPYDLQRLEVLRGPQGTLYGAGAMGGLLKYVLTQADPTAFSAQVGGELASTDGGSGLGYAERGAVNIPLIQDELAVRASVYDKHYQGYTDNVFLSDKDSNTGRQYGGRVGLMWKPVGNLRVNFNGIWNRTTSDDNAVVTLVATCDDVPAGAPSFCHGEPTLGRLAGSHTFLQPFSKSIDYYSASAMWDAPQGITVTSAASWSRAVTHRLQDATVSNGLIPTAFFGLPPGYSSFDVRLDLRKFTQELRAASPKGGRFEWLAGVFYTRETSANHQSANLFDTSYNELSGPPLFSPILLGSLPSTYKEYAGFGDLTLNVTDKLDMTGGVRYAHNEQVFTQILDGLLLGGEHIELREKGSEGVTTWSLSSRFRFTPDNMLYGKVATGYRPGGPNLAIGGAVPNVDSDTLTSYELGFKSTFLDGRALFNLSVYDIEWKDIQLRVINPTCGCSALANGGDAYSRGFELEGSFRALNGLTLGYNAAYTKAQLTSLLSSVQGFLTGYQLPGVPKWSGGLTADYHWSLNAQLTGTVGVGIRYVGGENVTPVSSTDPNTRDPSYTTGDLRAGLSNGRWNVTLFVRNVTNKLVYLSQSAQQDLVTLAVPSIDALPLQPRVIGLSADFEL